MWELNFLANAVAHSNGIFLPSLLNYMEFCVLCELAYFKLFGMAGNQKIAALLSANKF